MSLIGKYVIVRCRDAGVHAGYLKSYENRQAVLIDSRRLWHFEPVEGEWWLDGVAVGGVSQNSKLGTTNPNEKILTENCEIIGCSAVAEKSIREKANG